VYGSSLILLIIPGDLGSEMFSVSEGSIYLSTWTSLLLDLGLYSCSYLICWMISPVLISTYLRMFDLYAYA